MNRNYQKFIFTFILSIIILFTSCNIDTKIEAGKSNDGNTADKTIVSGVYKLNTIKIPDGYKLSSFTSDVNNVITHGDRIYAVCNKSQKYISNGQRRSSTNSIIYSVDLEGKDEKIFLLEEMNPILITSFDMDSEGNFYVLAGYNIYKMNPDGIPISQTEISE